MTAKSVDHFSFTIGDISRFLGKAKVTIRSWESQGLIRLPRESGDRRMTVSQMEDIVKWAYNSDKIGESRFKLTNDILSQLKLLEEVNDGKYKE